MELLIKKATINDLKDIQRLNRELFEKEFTDFDNTLNLDWAFSETGEEYFRDHITDASNCVFIALADGVIIGYLAGSLNEENSYRMPFNGAELENMFVLDAYRSQGIGWKIYDAFVEWCKSKDVNKISVTASIQNTEGRDFYRKKGFLDFSISLETNI